ncbi:MAG: M3 family metallopeptidase [Terracidiphilus sp.]|nr:M3 family metallopeptidase [Terracidiphilus sp.]
MRVCECVCLCAPVCLPAQFLCFLSALRPLPILHTGSDDVRAWDTEYYIRKLRGTESADLPAYLSIDNVLNGLRIVTSRVFGLTLTSVPVPPSEAWTGVCVCERGGDSGLLRCVVRV